MPEFLKVPTFLRHAGLATITSTATDANRPSYTIAEIQFMMVEVVDRTTRINDGSNCFMPQDRRSFFLAFSLDGMEVAAANCASLDLDEQFARLKFGNRETLNFQISAISRKHRGFACLHVLADESGWLGEGDRIEFIARPRPYRPRGRGQARRRQARAREARNVFA